MNMSDPSEYFHSESGQEDISIERYSSGSDSSLECLDVSLEGYTSSIDDASDDSRDSASNPEVKDDKSVIFKFYKTLSLKLLKTFSVEYYEVNASVEHLRNIYRRVSNGILPTQIDYTKKSNCIAYLYRYAACHTAMVFDTVSKMFDSSSFEVLSKLNKNSLNVMFLGGGPGNDFVGFLTALHSHHHHLFDMDVTVVDKMSGWEGVFNETIESLRQGDGGKAGSIFEEVNVTTTFISADLKHSEEWDETMQAKLENSDIVFFVKVLSHIPDGDKLKVLENVVICLKPGALLVYIDFPFPNKTFAALQCLRLVYQSNKTNYAFSLKSFKFGYSSISKCRAEVRVFERL